ncbi:MAG: class II fructose-bisphosphate aldolase [bacterium]
MALVTLKELYADAERNCYGIPAYDTCGGQLGILEAILSTAEEMRSPVIVSDGYPAMCFYFDPECYAEVAKMAIRKAKVPAALHLDHTFKFEHIVLAIKYGFTSVMFDGSRLSYEENVEISKKVVEVAHAAGVTVEAELGKVGGLEGDAFAQTDDSLYTDPTLAKKFIDETGIDALAPAIGTAHGFYKEEPKLDFQRLAKIKELTKIPLVMHGSTGVPIEDVRRAIVLGIRKINIATQIRAEFLRGVREYMERNPSDITENVIKSGREPLRKFMREQLAAFGCANRA